MDSNEWLYLIHLNINSLLPKIDKLPYKANSSSAAGGISESKFDESVLQSEIQVNNYDLIRRDRNRNGGGVACYIRIDIGYIQKQYFPEEIKNIFSEILLPKTNPLVVGLPKELPSQRTFSKF